MTKHLFRIFLGLSIIISFAVITGCGQWGTSSNNGSSAGSTTLASFSFTKADNHSLQSDVTSVISGTNIQLNVPYGTNVSALTATFDTAGAIVTVGDVVQISGVTLNDYTNPVTFTVTEQDGTTQSYTVTVIVAKFSDKSITSLGFASANNPGLSTDVMGIISRTNIALTVPHGTDVTELVATFATTGSTVTVGSNIQSSGTTANNFISPVTYTVTAADSSTKDYTVTVIEAPSSANDITSFEFAALNNSMLSFDVVSDISDTGIALMVPYGTDISALVATFETTGASVAIGSVTQASGVTANNFTNPLTYVVTAADSTTESYTITVTVALSSSRYITSFMFETSLNSNLSYVPGTIFGANIRLTVPYGTDLTSLTPTIAITGASVSPASGVAQDFSSSVTTPVYYTVTAADGFTLTYSVIVTAAKPSSAIGQIGPAGGLIFYDKVNYSTDGDGTWRYLEAAPYDQSDFIYEHHGTMEVM